MQRNNASRNPSATTRSKKGQRQNRNQAITTQNDRVLTRKFIMNEKVGLNTSLGTNTVLNRTLQWDGAEFNGFNSISAGFDQYRIRRLQVFVTSSASSVSQLQIAGSLAKQPLYANCSTTVYSAVDLTGGANPGPDIEAFQNCEFRQPDPNKATKIADFIPRLAQSSGLLYTANTWVSTSNTTQLWNALHLRFVNSNGTLIFPSPSDPQEFNVRTVAHVEFRHPIYDVATLAARLQMVTEIVPARVERGELASVEQDVVTENGLPRVQD